MLLTYGRPRTVWTRTCKQKVLWNKKEYNFSPKGKLNGLFIYKTSEHRSASVCIGWESSHVLLNLVLGYVLFELCRFRYMDYSRTKYFLLVSRFRFHRFSSKIKIETFIKECIEIFFLLSLAVQFLCRFMHTLSRIMIFQY